VICLLLWLNLTAHRKALGAVWMVVEIALGAWKTAGFRRGFIDFELPSDEKRP